MTLGELIKKNRKKHKLTQSALAKAMQVTDMTVYRMEQDKEFRLTDNVVGILSNLIPFDELKEATPTKMSEKLLGAFSQRPINGTNDLNEAVIKVVFDAISPIETHQPFQDYVSFIAPQLRAISFENSSESSRVISRKYRCDYLFENKQNCKLWGLDFFLESRLALDNEPTRYLMMWLDVCKTHRLDRISIVVDFNVKPYLRELKTAWDSEPLACDFTVLHYSKFDKMIDDEYEVFVSGAGDGLFDTEVADPEVRIQALSDKIRWIQSMKEDFSLSMEAEN